MKRDTLFGFVVILIILCGIIWYAASPTKTPVPTAPNLTGSAYVEHTATYTIAANYATTTPLLATVGSEANAAALTTMKSFISDTINQFKIDAAGGSTTNGKETLQIAYLMASSPHTISYIFTTYTDTLGVHPNTLFTTFTFDTQSGTLLTLADIFTPGAEYLDMLSQISRAQLPGVIGNSTDTAVLQNGTIPTNANFSNFFFDNQDFVILFNTYQVAPFADGPQTLRIPLSELSSILKSEYQ
jgi:hypothetical protein